MSFYLYLKDRVFISLESERLSFLPVIVITSLACVITNDFYFHIPKLHSLLFRVILLTIFIFLILCILFKVADYLRKVY